MWFAPLRRFGSSPAFTPAPTPSRLRSVPGGCSAINHHPPTSLTPAPVTSALVHPMVHALHGVCVCEGCSVRHLCYRRSFRQAFPLCKNFSHAWLPVHVVACMQAYLHIYRAVEDLPYLTMSCLGYRALSCHPHRRHLSGSMAAAVSSPAPAWSAGREGLGLTVRCKLASLRSDPPAVSQPSDFHL